MKKVSVITLGCKVNQYESASFKTSFEDAGYTIATAKEEAEIIVINTCAVTANAGAQSRQAIRHAVRTSPDADIIITGCFAEIGARELSEEKELLGRNYSVIGNSKKSNLVQNALTRAESGGQILPGSIKDAKEICRLPVRRFGDRSRAYLRIQDGCESYCTYCIVPYTRGPSRSLPRTEVIEQAKVFASEGHREIVLTGIHLGLYGKDLGPKESLASLLDEISLATPGIFYRVSSLEPGEVTDDILSLLKDRDNIQPHLHIPLQSGDDEILSRMNRKYTTAQFGKIINKYNTALPDGALGIDILTGFPGETDAHFNNSLTFLKNLKFSYLHVFPYSIRPGTVAAGFSNQVTKKTKHSRVAALRNLSDSKKHAFYNSHISRSYPVLVEGNRNKEGLLKGFTSNYIAVNFEGPDSLLNSITRVKLLSLEEGDVRAEIEEKNEG
ncbi:MAG: tRNA (N(6)-L-threonylcarbamoyladenosine(37)-C(2))-methylthiotransferase MtaB [Deltaproteobacteria bacterium]|nr:tRNA (N(6)-L-threonylcarbamoyladenosine(37)-C(2))-methylthiotransferase MtaB [Deltaproteobacteria bacterium]